jgi:hypothetical protein
VDRKFRLVSVIQVRKLVSVTSQQQGRCELDSHADNSMLGKGARVLEEYSDKFQVFG